MAKNFFLALWIIQKCISVIFEWSSWPDYVALCWKTFSTITMCNIKSIQHTKLKKMAKNIFGSFKNEFFCFLNDPAWAISWPNLLTPLSIVKICNIKSIQQTYKNAFLWFLNDPAWAISWPNCENHLVLSKCAISSWSNGQNSRKWPKTGKNFSKVYQNFPEHAVFTGSSKKAVLS